MMQEDASLLRFYLVTSSNDHQLKYKSIWQSEQVALILNYGRLGLHLFCLPTPTPPKLRGPPALNANHSAWIEKKNQRWHFLIQELC